MYAIGIDIGTTSICGIVMDTATGQVVSSCTRSGDAFLSTPYPWEKIQDPHKLIRIAKEILDDFLTAYPAAVIGLTGQMHGIVYFDKDGCAVSPLYIWQDGRGNQPYEDTTYAGYLNSHSGYGNVTDFYNRKNGLYPDSAAGYCTIMDYLGMVLCGLKKPLMHTTNAASLGCFSLETLSFSYDTDVTVTGEYQLLGSYRGIPVSVAIGDNQASVFSTLVNEKDLLINVGTGSQVSMITNRICTGDNIETRPYFDGKYLAVGAALCGGRSYGLFRDFLASFLQAAKLPDTDIYSVLGQLLDKQENLCGSPVVDTRFDGTRSNPDITGSITGLTTQNFTPGHLAWGILDGMMAELQDMYLQMQLPHENLVGSGNGIRLNPSLVRIAQNRFGGSLQIPAHTEEAACGAALFGTVAAGIFDSASLAQQLVQYQKQEA